MIYLFDLDNTLWDTFDKNGNPIWAKQLVPPYQIKDDVVTDDVFSYCRLRKGVREYLEHLQHEDNQLGFISVGSYFGMAFSKQPSIQMLDLFNISQYLNRFQVLEYKTFNKATFIDVNPKNFASLKDNVICVDALNIHDWSQLIGKKYD
jgi:predicted phosphatase